MALKAKIKQALQITEEGREFVQFIASRKNKMQCYANAPKLLRLLKAQGLDVVLVGCHYPQNTTTCTNFYVLCKEGSEVLLLDPTANVDLDKDELHMATYAEAQRDLATVFQCRELWDLNQIVIYPPLPNDSYPENPDWRGKFKQSWGEFSSAMVFQDERKIAKPETRSETGGSALGDKVTKADLANRFGRRAHFNYF